MVALALPRGSQSLLYVHGPRWEYRRDADDPHTATYIPARVLSLVRPERDIIVLPGKQPAVREYANFCMRLLGIRPWQVLYTSGTSYQVQTDARHEVLQDLRKLVSKGEWAMVPYAVTPSVLKLARDLGLSVIGDSPRWVSRFGTKAILHPNAITSKRPAHLPLLEQVCGDIPRPRGYLAMDLEELNMAFGLLSDQRIDDILVKPVSGSTGEGIMAMKTSHGPNGYTLPLGPVLVEETLRIDHDQDGKIIAPSVQYVRNELGHPSDQIMHGLSHSGNRFPSETSASFKKEFIAYARRILDWASPRGLGGFDALSVAGKPIFVDVNAGRWTGAHPALLFRSTYAANSHVISWKHHPRLHVEEIWEKLQRHEIAFQPGKTSSGVFPLCHLRGMWAMHVAIGETPCEVKHLAEKAQAL